MSWAVLPSFIVRNPHLSCEAKTVLACISSHYNDETGRAWPSVQTLVEYTGTSRSGVQRALRELSGCSDGCDLAHVHRPRFVRRVERYVPTGKTRHGKPTMTQTSNEYRLEFNRWGDSVAPKTQEKRQPPPCDFDTGVPVDKSVRKTGGRVAGGAGGRVAREAQTATIGTTSEFNPPNPLSMKGGIDEIDGIGQDRARNTPSGDKLTRAQNRAERKALDEGARFIGLPCDVCDQKLPEVAIVELANGRRFANVQGHHGRWMDSRKGGKIFIATSAAHWHCINDA